MKRLFFFLTLLAALNIHAQQSYTIRGELPDSLDGATVKMVDDNTKQTFAETVLKDGRFEMKGTVERDSLRQICVFQDDNRIAYADIIVEEGEICVDFATHFCKGTRQNDLMPKLLMVEETETMMREGRNDDWSRIRSEIKSGLSHAVLEYKDNALACWALFRLSLLVMFDNQAEEFVQLYESAGEYAQSHSFARSTWQAMKNRLGVTVGSMFSDFEIPTGAADSTSVRLSDFIGRGKFVLVDFWASWCKPCRAETPNLKAVHERFGGDRLEIVSIAVNDKRSRTLQAIEEDGPTWRQVFDANGKLISLYGSTSIPLIILFSPDGHILSYNLRGGAIMKAVEEALGE